MDSLISITEIPPKKIYGDEPYQIETTDLVTEPRRRSLFDRAADDGQVRCDH